MARAYQSIWKSVSDTARVKESPRRSLQGTPLRTTAWCRSLQGTPLHTTAWCQGAVYRVRHYTPRRSAGCHSAQGIHGVIHQTVVIQLIFVAVHNAHRRAVMPLRHHSVYRAHRHVRRTVEFDEGKVWLNLGAPRSTLHLWIE